MERVPHLLLIDSIEDDRAVLCQLLESLSVHVIQVSSGLEAVEVLQTVAIDLVVTSISIGEFDSWRLARFIRCGICQGGRILPIIIVTRVWCERITEITARDFGINHLLAFEDRHLLPATVLACLESPTKGLGKRSVLVVEDHEDTAHLVEKILKARFEVEIAVDGHSGLAAWKERRHDLVLLDIMLPGLSGDSVLGKILQIDSSQPIVMMTAHGSTDVAKKLLLAGAADFVTKPFRADELRRVCELATRREDYLVSNAQVVERMDSLQQLRNLLENIVDSMPSVLIGVDREGAVNLWNRQAELISEISADVAQGQKLVDVWPTFSEIKAVHDSLLQGEVRKLSKIAQQRGEKVCYCDITIYPLYETSVVGAVIRIDDVTERVLLEERIMQSEKMVSMGHLAAGLAHEVNNPLAGVIQNIQVVRHRLSEQSSANCAAAKVAGIDMEALAVYLRRREVDSLLDVVMNSGKRAAQLIENMLSFSRRDNSSMLPCDLASLIDKSVELAAGSFSLEKQFDFRSIEVQRDFERELPFIECNPVQIQQVIFNLLMNGAHAMEQKLQTFRASPVTFNYRPRFVLRTRYLNQRARIEIEDNGPGMDEMTKKRLFEPFYTTKNIGEGTGLGLSICYFIMTENHQGSLTVDSSRHVGTRFVLEIPHIRG